MSESNLLASLRFHGKRFEGHAMDVDCVGELQAYKEIVLECAKVLWTRGHTDKERLPKKFEERLLLQFSEVREGSAKVPLLRVKSQPQAGTNGTLDFSEYDEFDEAAALVDLAIEAASRDELLPDTFPRNVIPLFRNFGKSLKDDEVLFLQARKRQSEASYTAVARKRLSEWTETTYEDRVDIVGEVSMANVRGSGFELLIAAGQPPVKGKFSLEQEAEVLDALRSHKTMRLRVIGVGEFLTSDRTLRKIVDIESAAIATGETVHQYADVKPIWEIVAGIGESVPEDSWKNVPNDLSKHLDYYLYSGKERS